MTREGPRDPDSETGKDDLSDPGRRESCTGCHSCPSSISPFPSPASGIFSCLTHVLFRSRPYPPCPSSPVPRPGLPYVIPGRPASLRHLLPGSSTPTPLRPLRPLLPHRVLHSVSSQPTRPETSEGSRVRCRHSTVV